VADVHPRFGSPINALLLMTIPSLIVSWLYAYNIFDFQTLALDATLVIAVTFLGSTLAAVILPWRKKHLFEGSPLARVKAPSWLSWLVLALYGAGSIWLIYNSVRYGIGALGEVAGALPWITVIVMWVLTVGNAILLLWVLYYVGTRLSKEGRMPLVTLAGLIFLFFLDWLLVEWAWDPNFLYGIGWQNASSVVFMLANYLLAAIIYFGFKYYRRSKGIDIDLIYKEIPAE